MAAKSPDQRAVEFHLSSLWSWLPGGCKRILEALESCDFKQAHFSWDESCDWFHIRCLEDDKAYIMNEYLKAQSEIESELKEKDLLQENGNPIPTVENDLIKTSRPRAAVPEEPAPEETVDIEVVVRTERVGTQRSNGQSRIERRTERKAVSKSTDYRF